MKLRSLLAIMLAFASPALAQTINANADGSGKLLAPITAATPECVEGNDNADGCLEGTAKDANGNPMAEVQASNATHTGAIDAGIYKAGKLLAVAR